MNARLLVLLLLVALPAASAAAPPGVTVGKETDTVGVSEDGLLVFLMLQYTVSDPGAYAANATWRLYTPDTAAEPIARLTRNGAQTTVDAGRVNATAPSGPFSAWTIDLKGLLGGLQRNENQTLSLSFTVPEATRVRFKAPTALPQLLVFVENAGNRPVTGEGVGPFIAAGASHHATASNVADGAEYAVTIQAAPGAGARNLNPYLWGLGGLVLGFVAATVMRGRSPRAKKFEKGGAMESQKFLEARRRTLMAALKELEVAHEAKEIPDEAYAPLKEEYKAQAVRVMRSLEEKREPGQGPGGAGQA